MPTNGVRSSRAIRLVFTSRRRLVRDAMCAYLAGRPEFTVVGQTGTIDGLTELCRLRRPDAVLVDAVELTLAMVEALLRVRAAAPGVELVVAYAEASSPALEAAIDAGVTAVVPCNHGLDAVLRRVRDLARPRGRRQPDGLVLTPYDMRVLSLLSSGHSVPEMAELLGIGVRTVENHKRRLYSKLGVGNSSGAAGRAASLGLIDSASGPVRHERMPRPLIVVHGRAGPVLDAVRDALVAASLPHVGADALVPLDGEDWALGQRGHIVSVLVDPTYHDWLLSAGVGARTIVVLSHDPDLPTFLDMLLRGACGLVRASDVADDLTAVLSVVASGYLAMDATHIDELAGWVTVRMADGSPDALAPTAREVDMLASIANGLTIRQTAHALGIAAKTVENTLARLYRKLGARNRSEAVTIAHRLGLLESHLAVIGPGQPQAATSVS